MPYELIISEKPNAAKKIAEALADSKPLREGGRGVTVWNITHNDQDIKVVCAVGHLYSVAEKEKSFKYPSYDIEWVPTTEIDKYSAYTKKYLNTIKKAAKDADAFTVACDYDIEGEVIGLNVIRYTCGQQDANRMKFSTLTRDDLTNAYQHKQPHLDWGQAKAGETRHFLDWLYGINLSRALMTAVKTAGSFMILSSGRVQGPALKIIVDKEREIRSFKPKPFWQLELRTEKDQQPIVASHKEDKFWEEEKAQDIYNKCKGKEAQVTSVQEKEFQQAPPWPFDLGSLQSEAYRNFGISPKHTLQIAQNLYLAGVTSYPRTSSQKLPKEIGYKKILELLAQQQNYTEKARHVLDSTPLRPNEGKKIDPAHPAVYPTGHDPGRLEGRDQKIYDLIVKRFLATFGEAATRETLTAELVVEEEPFITKGTTTKKPGWHTLYDPYVKLKEQQLPKLQQDERVPQKDLQLLAKETTPPKRYTPSSIISELEKRGLGTKATRADIIEALYQRGYINEQSIEATELGNKTIATLEKYCPEIIDEELTKTFEEGMENIREDKEKPERVLDHAKRELTKTLEKFKEHEQAIGKELIEAERETKDQQATLGTCPKCKQGKIKITYSKKTKKRFVGCSNYPDCDFTAPLPQAGMIKATGKVCKHDGYPIINIRRRGKRPQNICLNIDCPSKQPEAAREAVLEAEEHAHVKKCPKCGKDMKLRKSIYGEFWGCTGYPKCKHTEPLNGNNSKEEGPKR
ncbi:DNA topoisomerase I [Candidatus Woesearchaeota archaeon]|nr:DNA topoisomerase I [Candidatus Woesearchaeota archaeon]